VWYMQILSCNLWWDSSDVRDELDGVNLCPESWCRCLGKVKGPCVFVYQIPKRVEQSSTPTKSARDRPLRRQEREKGTDITRISYNITIMDISSTSPAHPSNQSPDTAPSTWTKDASSWTPSKATSLLPTSIPLSKPHRGWDRVPKAPVAQHSRVKQVWRREYGLRSQPNTEEKGGQEQEEAPSNASKRSPTRIVKKKRTRSPTKNSGETEGNDEGEPNHAPTRWERRRSSFRREWPVIRIATGIF
jgi:hypothetical protein